MGELDQAQIGGCIYLWNIIPKKDRAGTAGKELTVDARQQGKYGQNVDTFSLVKNPDPAKLKDQNYPFISPK